MDNQHTRIVPGVSPPQAARPFSFEAPAGTDMTVIIGQLGRQPRGVIGIARRCRYGLPQVAVNAPLHVHADRVEVFPTLCWLTCPLLIQATSRLEAAGWIDVFERNLDQDPDFRQGMQSAHNATARARTALVPQADLAWIRSDYPSQYYVLTSSGVAGLSRPDRIKCLHAHLADFLARGDNQVGARVYRLLEDDGVPLDGDGRCRLVCR